MYTIDTDTTTARYYTTRDELIQREIIDALDGSEGIKGVDLQEAAEAIYDELEKARITGISPTGDKFWITHDYEATESFWEITNRVIGQTQ